MNFTSQRSPYTNVYVDASLNAAHVECERFIPSATFRQNLLSIIELIKAKKLFACIYDIRKLKSLPPQDQDWFIDVAFPLLIKTSLRKIAVLESATSAGLLDLNQLVYTHYPSIPFELQYFEDVASSLEWISNPLPTVNESSFATRKEMAPAF
ncbi:hypothetical protein [Rufibacter sp. XAAS-G3-1]|uniref:hypothetical protein n=1 Tax=Rufibacter sp. XAAS-G3-1 TaxID=2729134 RepID=UPI0015E66E53|nr:hypothetical protein [Rufibacter sp. XAAS-G3-1]